MGIAGAGGWDGRGYGLRVAPVNSRARFCGGWDYGFDPPRIAASGQARAGGFGEKQIDALPAVTLATIGQIKEFVIFRCAEIGAIDVYSKPNCGENRSTTALMLHDSGFATSPAQTRDDGRRNPNDVMPSVLIREKQNSTARVMKHASGDKRFKILEVHMKKHQFRQDALIEVMHKAQELFGYLEDDVLLFVSYKLKLPPSRVYGVATFYHFFSSNRRVNTPAWFASAPPVTSRARTR